MQTRKPLAVVSYLAVLGLLLASCAPAAAPPPTTAPAAAPPASTPAPAALSPTPKPAAEQPKRGGVLNRSISADTPSYDIHQGSGLIHLAPIGPAYNGLVQYDPFQPGTVVPDLAEKWAISGDGLTYTFNLRKGVKWHDGTPFSSADVPLSIERVKKHGSAGPGLVAIKTVEAPDDATVKIMLSYPSASVLNYVALAWAVIMPKHILDKKGNMKEDVVGTGAFKFKRHERGSFLELERNPNYWEPGRPYLDGVRVYAIGDEASSIAALRTGRVDVIYLPSEQTVEVLKRNYKEGTVAMHRKANWRAIALPTDRAPWSDIRVRKAVYLTIDRQTAIKVLMSDTGELGGVIPESMGGIPTEELLKRPGYRQPKDQDIAEAKKLLAEAGFASGLKTSTMFRKRIEFESQAVFMREQLARIGIDVSLRPVDDATYFDLRTKRAYETFSYRNGMAVREPDAILNAEWKTGGPDNWSNISDPELDRLIGLQSREQDPEKRKAIVRQISEKIEGMYSTTILGWTGLWKAWGPRLKNYTLPAQYHDGDKYVHVWLDK
ncbi:MAG: ABC transporter substrate-binding protein [Chloroflexi bacterium]|nr:ABC transporter substrate-binding protein [Chloroflexota bacterium]